MSSGMLFVINLDDLLFPENQKPKQKLINKLLYLRKKGERESTNSLTLSLC